MTSEQLAPVLLALGCPAEKALEMAQQLDKRARQLQARDGRTHAAALEHLLGLLKQGWAAQSRGVS